MDLQEYERIVPNAQVDGISFLTPNSQCAWRVQTLYTKEPDTIAWLREMQPGSVLFDVGSNMGQYAMLAAKSGVIVHAFEPEAQNFALLVRNCALNSSVLGGRLTAWPIALSDHFSLDILHLSGMIPGGSCHSYGASTNFKGESHQFPYSQGSVATTIDLFCAQFGRPDYIKIDVDGFEHLVIRGAEATLPSVQSVLVEINTDYAEHMEYLVPHMLQLGFTYSEAQAHDSRRKEGPFTGVGNIIFRRG
jgi:FkbM family methyltransferase